LARSTRYPSDDAGGGILRKEGRVADYERIETEAALKHLAKEMANEPVIAFDTEADSFYHYFDKTCLVQAATRDRVFLIDPLALGGPAEMRPLAPVFASKRIRKIFHAAEYDLFVLKRDCGFEFQNLFDTMISAQLLGYPAVGLAALAKHHFGLSMPKDEQRSDWSARPLRESQLQYAAADASHLIVLSERMERELEEHGRKGWAQWEFDNLVRREGPVRGFDEAGYLRIKGATGLDPTELSVLRELYLMRDGRAREVDRPPFKVLGNRTLLEVAGRQPESNEALGRIKGVTDLILRRLGREMLDAVAKGIKKPHGPIKRVPGTGRKRMDRQTEKRLGRLKRWRSVRAKDLNLDPGVLCPNSALEAIAWCDPSSPSQIAELVEVKSWFTGDFGSEVVELLTDQGE
jgi:ribonuclease D